MATSGRAGQAFLTQTNTFQNYEKKIVFLFFAIEKAQNPFVYENDNYFDAGIYTEYFRDRVGPDILCCKGKIGQRSIWDT
jgi:hypothetical protein